MTNQDVIEINAEPGKNVEYEVIGEVTDSVTDEAMELSKSIPFGMLKLRFQDGTIVTVNESALISEMIIAKNREVVD